MIQKILLVCSFFVLGLGSNETLHTVNDCSSTIHTGHIQSYVMVPSAPVAGQEIRIIIDYILDSPVTGGEAIYTASFNGFPLPPTTQPLCPDLETTTPCPIVAGPVHFEGTSVLGDGNTHGTLVTTTTWKDQDGNQILCWGFTVRI
jgi:hypothetical protein